ncbi:MAG: hypothetical protein HOK97_16750 [Deltaproteobacteria bacterium]|nr:hypothetical protein [Deltaproteobacteria bacterium]
MDKPEFAENSASSYPVSVSSPKASLVYNPGSGRGQGEKNAQRFAEDWQSRFGTEVTLRPTQSYEDIRVASKETFDPDGIQILMGGDGTFSECLQGLAELNNFEPLQTPVGLLPGGSGNSFLRDFDAHTYEVARDAIFEAVENQETTPIDVGLCSYQEYKSSEPSRPGQTLQRLSFNIWGLGLIADIAALAIKMRFLGGLNYTVATLIKLFVHRPTSLKTLLNGKARNFKSNMVCISNSRYTGGAMEMAPPVRVNDGKLFFVCSEIRSRLKLFGLFPSIFSGKHLQADDMTAEFIETASFEAQEPFFFNVDGELDWGFNPQLRVQPGYFKLWMSPKRLK